MHYFMLPPLRVLAVAGLLSVVGNTVTRAQGEDPPTPDPVAVRTHLNTLRDRRLPAERKVPAMRALLELGSNARYQLAFHAGRECARFEKRFTAGSESFLHDFEREAGSLVSRRLDRETLAEIQTLRATVAGNARNGDLARSAIEARSDPAMARLGVILTVRPNDVYDHNEDLFSDLVVLLDNLDERKVLTDHWKIARERLAQDTALRTRVARLETPADPRAEENALYSQIELLALLSTPMEKADRQALLANLELSEKHDEEEMRGIDQLNTKRIHAGLAALRLDVRLGEASRGHSEDMVRLGFFSHTSPVKGKESFGRRASLAGTSASGENIAAGQNTGKGAIRAWWYSPGHHRNMMGGGHRRIGLGRCEATWTMMLGG
jgi:uncharacterized protein YkwD